MFSPAAVQLTPSSVSRVPSGASPGHWWDSPQPPAIRRLCAAELASRPEVIVRAGNPAAARAWLISASTCAAAAPSWVAGEPVEVATGAGGRVLAVAVAGASGRGDGDEAGREGDGLAWPGGLVTTAGGAARTTAADVPAHGPAALAPVVGALVVAALVVAALVVAALHVGVVARGPTAAIPDREPWKNAPSAR
jgi:hypothetical protein